MRFSVRRICFFAASARGASPRAVLQQAKLVCFQVPFYTEYICYSLYTFTLFRYNSTLKRISILKVKFSCYKRLNGVASNPPRRKWTVQTHAQRRPVSCSQCAWRSHAGSLASQSLSPPATHFAQGSHEELTVCQYECRCTRRTAATVATTSSYDNGSWPPPPYHDQRAHERQDL